MSLVSTAAKGGTGSSSLWGTFTRATDGTIDIQSIPATGSDLVVSLIGRATVAATSDTLNLLLNNDSGGNYYRERLSGTAATPAAAETLAASALACGALPAASAAAGLFGCLQITIFGYTSTTWQKLILFEQFGSFGTLTGNQVLGAAGGLWASTAVVNRLTFSCASAANLLTASTARVYIVS